MSWIAAGVAVVGGGIKMYQGYKQKKDGQEMEDGLNKPDFVIPEEALKNLSIAEKEAYNGLPENQKRAFLENQQRTSQTALRNSSDRRGGLGIVSQVQGQENLSNRQLLIDDTKARQQNMQRASDARNVMSDYKMKRFEHQYNEYSSDLDYARGIQGAGLQNMNTATSEIAGGVMQGVGGMNANKQAELDREAGLLPRRMNSVGPTNMNMPTNNVIPNTLSTVSAPQSTASANFGAQLDFYRFPLNGINQ